MYITEVRVCHIITEFEEKKYFTFFNQEIIPYIVKFNMISGMPNSGSKGNREMTIGAEVFQIANSSVPDVCWDTGCTVKSVEGHTKETMEVAT